MERLGTATCPEGRDHDLGGVFSGRVLWEAAGIQRSVRGRRDVDCKTREARVSERSRANQWSKKLKRRPLHVADRRGD